MKAIRTLTYYSGDGLFVCDLYKEFRKHICLPSFKSPFPKCKVWTRTSHVKTDNHLLPYKVSYEVMIMNSDASVEDIEHMGNVRFPDVEGFKVEDRMNLYEIKEQDE